MTRPIHGHSTGVVMVSTSSGRALTSGYCCSVMSRCPLDCHLVMRTIRRLIPFESIELPGEFFPAHLSVALLEAIFPSREGHDDQGTRAAMRYSRRFEIAYTRTDRWELPPAEEQETLSDLIGRYTELGEDRMAEMLFPTDQRCPKRSSRGRGISCAPR